MLLKRPKQQTRLHRAHVAVRLEPPNTALALKTAAVVARACEASGDGLARVATAQHAPEQP